MHQTSQQYAGLPQNEKLVPAQQDAVTPETKKLG
jgi:hypothetical protein